MENFLSNEMAIILIIMLVTVMIAIIFLLITSKQFHIKNVDVELEDFLNHLYVASTQSNKDTHKVVEIFIQELKSYEDQHGKTKESLNNVISKVASELQGMKEHIGSIQELSLEKEEKIRRYESGYDQAIIKNFTTGLFRILETIKEEQAKENSDSLSEIQEDILILLENNGIEKIDIELGKNYKEYSKVAKVVRTEMTTDSLKDSTVKEIKKDGYITQINESTIKIHIPAEVIVYKLNTGIEDV
jgi:hypothetical protein